MDSFHEGWLKFKIIAKKEGYTEKVVGDYSFRRLRRRKGKMGFIKLINIDREGNIRIVRSEQ